jgi:hypothetical protein
MMNNHEVIERYKEALIENVKTWYSENHAMSSGIMMVSTMLGLSDITLDRIWDTLKDMLDEVEREMENG